jgi:hypothetical protein
MLSEESVSRQVAEALCGRPDVQIANMVSAADYIAASKADAKADLNYAGLVEVAAG